MQIRAAKHRTAHRTLVFLVVWAHKGANGERHPSESTIRYRQLSGHRHGRAGVQHAGACVVASPDAVEIEETISERDGKICWKDLNGLTRRHVPSSGTCQSLATVDHSLTSPSRDLSATGDEDYFQRRFKMHVLNRSFLERAVVRRGEDCLLPVKASLKLNPMLLSAQTGIVFLRFEHNHPQDSLPSASLTLFS